MTPDPTILPIENKVASSGLITLDLETFSHPGERILFDIKPWLFREMILKEKEFRESVKQHDWTQYSGKNIAFTCTSDALIPTWAYMLLAIHAEPFAHRYVFGDLQTLETLLFQEALNALDPNEFTGKRIIIKGCGKVHVPVSAYVEITHKLLPVAKTLMYGEACSSVPLFKKGNG